VIPGEGRDLSVLQNIQTSFFSLPSLLADRYWKLFPWGQSRPSMKLTIHLCLVLKLRIHGAVHPLPSWHGAHFSTGTDLPCTLVCWKDTLTLLIIINEQFSWHLFLK